MRGVNKARARMAILFVGVASSLVGVVGACSSDPAVASSTDAGVDASNASPEASVMPAVDAGPVTGCEYSSQADDCLCGSGSGHYDCGNASFGGSSICRNQDCYCTCDHYNCQTSDEGCDCSPFKPGSSDVAVASCRANDGGADAGVCCLWDTSDTCSCYSTRTKCSSGSVQVPSCDLVDIRAKLAPRTFYQDEEEELVTSCNGLIGRNPKSKSCSGNVEGCSTKGCGIPITCAPTAPKCCNPTCDLTTDKCVLICKP